MQQADERACMVWHRAAAHACRGSAWLVTLGGARPAVRTGLAEARTEVRALSVAMMPALATLTVCCSITSCSCAHANRQQPHCRPQRRQDLCAAVLLLPLLLNLPLVCAYAASDALLGGWRCRPACHALVSFYNSGLCVIRA